MATVSGEAPKSAERPGTALRVGWENTSRVFRDATAKEKPVADERPAPPRKEAKALLGADYWCG